MKTLVLTAIAMLAFAANSLLCRMALGAGLIDAASFTSIRITSGAVMLALLILPGWQTRLHRKPDWLSVAALFSYMIFFSFAYLSLSAGTGALILFGAVQLTMFIVASRAGETFTAPSWFGLILALGGFVYLVSPGVTAPDPLAAAMMATAGIAWGWYSLLGRNSAVPMEATAWNFIYCVPLAAVASVLFMREFHVTMTGVLLAAASGAIASGLGYFVWYAALRGLAAMRAATVQLSVPLIAAFGGVLLLNEVVTIRLLLASVAILGGVAIVLRQKPAPAKSS